MNMSRKYGEWRLPRESVTLRDPDTTARSSAPLTRSPRTPGAVESQIEVPGAAKPARNLFDVAQALSWVAGRRESIEDQTDWVRTIPSLIGHLANGVKSS